MTARDPCVIPCPPSIISQTSVQIPFMGKIGASSTLALQGGCSGCELVGNFMAQLNPLLASMGLPLCILRCVASLITFVKAVPDSLGPPPDPGKLISAVTGVVSNCQCILQVALPPPAGMICQFLQMTRDFVGIIVQVCTCVTGLLTHLLQLNIKASILLGNPNVHIQATGRCLAQQVQVLTAVLADKFNGLNMLLSAVQAIFEILSIVPGVSGPINDMIAAINAFTIHANTPGKTPAEILVAMNTLNSVLATTYQVLQTAAAPCP